MNTQTLGDLASDQKIDKVFHAFGHSIPVGKDGRRMWPTKFKREMAKQMNSGTLSVSDVQKTCPVSDKAVYQWKKAFGKNDKRKFPVNKLSKRAFSEIKVIDDRPESSLPSELIILKYGGCELRLLNRPLFAGG